MAHLCSVSITSSRTSSGRLSTAYGTPEERVLAIVREPRCAAAGRDRPEHSCRGHGDGSTLRRTATQAESAARRTAKKTPPPALNSASGYSLTIIPRTDVNRPKTAEMVLSWLVFTSSAPESVPQAHPHYRSVFGRSHRPDKGGPQPPGGWLFPATRKLPSSVSDSGAEPLRDLS